MIRRISYKNLFNNAKTTYQKNKWLFWFTIFIILLSFPNPNGIIGHGLDPSWRAFLNYAHSKGAIWGENTFFTYGPLGFLEATFNINHNLFVSNVIWLVVYFIHICAIFNIASRSECTKLNSIMAAISVILYTIYCASPSSPSLYMCIVIFTLMIALWQGEQQYILPFNLLMALLFFIKFSSFFIAAIALSGFTLFHIIINKNIKKVLPLWFCAPLSIGAYLIYNPSLHSFLRYIKGILEISVGYNYAMSLSHSKDGTVFWVIPGIIICLTIFILLWRDNRSYAGIYATLVSSLLFFYKEGFVRHGGSTCFFGVAAIFSLILFSFNISDILAGTKDIIQKKALIGCTIVVILICFFFSGANIVNIFGSPASKIFYYPSNLLSYMNDIGSDAATLPKEFKAIIGEESVAAFPVELSYGVDDDLNFRWMPIIQNYTAYTPWCDTKNAMYFRDNDSAPEFIIFGFHAIDERYPLIETPLTWHAIKDNYDCVLEQDGLSLLKRKEIPQSSAFTGEYISSNTLSRTITAEYKTKEDEYTVKIPADAKYVSISTKLGIRGTLQKLFWKIPEVNLEIKCDDNSILSGRVLLEMLETPISIDEIGRTTNYNAAVADIPQRVMTELKFTGNGAEAYKEITINWYKETEPAYTFVGKAEEVLKDYTLIENLEIKYAIDKIKKTSTSISLINGWIYAPWNYAQNVLVSCDGNLYLLNKTLRADATSFLNVTEEKKLGISGIFPSGSKYSFIIFDPDYKVFCNLDFNTGD